NLCVVSLAIKRSDLHRLTVPFPNELTTRLKPGGKKALPIRSARFSGLQWGIGAATSNTPINRGAKLMVQVAMSASK
ncbi:MAG: hypothetical protein KGY70_15155, partial [Bacteroidales bacterium]|nr:hypothetical protein [Bacteroidales bacterium]